MGEAIMEVASGDGEGEVGELVDEEGDEHSRGGV
jgi:hypothetical protein